MWAACKLQVLRIIQNKARTKSRIKNITKRKRDSKKGKGGVSCESFHRICAKNRGGGGLFVIQSAKQTGAKCVGCAY